jgi:DHA2 family multidrug resistance protein-like MFS transporter
MAAGAAALPAAKASRREWIGLAVLALPCMLYSMDLTVLNLAVPSLSAELKPSAAELLWIVDIYGFLVAGSLITMGTLGDRIGRRKVLLIGAAAFGVASVFAAFATSAAMLIATRAALGVAAATLAPSTLSLIRNMFHDPRERTVAVSIWIMSYSAGAAIGPLIGGVLLAHFWWGSVFLINVPVMLALLALGPVLLPEFRDPNAGRMDLVSAAQSLAAVLAVIYGLKRLAEGGSAGVAALAIAIGVAVGAAFLRRQARLADPLIDLRLFRVRAFSAALAVNLLGFLTTFATFLFIAQYLQSVLGLSPLAAGLWGLPSTLAFIGGSTLTPMIVRRFHPAHVIAGGMTVAAAGFVLLALVDDVASPLAMLVAGSVVFSVGLTPVVTLTTDIVLTAAPPERAGAASALSETSSELGGALGIAVMGSIVTAIYRVEIAGTLPAGLPADAAAAASSTIGSAVAAADALPGALGAEVLDAARDAFAHAFGASAAISAAVAIGVAAMAVATLRRVPAHAPANESTATVRSER